MSLVVSNYVLWPLANFVEAKLVPQRHRNVSRHIITVRRSSKSWRVVG